MRRWLAILLLVLLPTQMSWAAVADYCAHESGAAADHVGHHDHATHGQALADAADVHDADDGAASAADIDCGHCHGQCAGMLLWLVPASLDRLASTPLRADDAPSAVHTSAQPERPQWARLA